MMRLRILWLAAFLGVLTACSCSQKTATPITPDDSGIDSSLPVIEFPGEKTTHSLLGMWNVNFNLDELTAKITSDKRDAAQHFNVTPFIAPEIQINSWDPVTEVIDVDVAITNPYAIDVYDVRLIIYTDTVGHRLQNDDDWTSLYDIPGGLPINPFKAYAKEVQDRKFAGLAEHTENLQIFLPGGNSNVTFAIDASYPGNCLEPHKIGNLSQGVLYDVGGSTSILQVGVYDHQNNVDSVALYMPEITGSTTPVPFGYIGYSGWELLRLVNNTTATSGEYNGFLVASSADSSSRALFDDVTIQVTHVEENWVNVWASVPDTREVTYDTRCFDMAIDGDGNIYVAGEFGILGCDFDPGPDEDFHYSNGHRDAYLLKFDSDMNFLWCRTWGGVGSDQSNKLSIDNENNVYVAGQFRELVDFDPGPGIDERSSNGGKDVFLSKFSADGNFIRAFTWGGTFNDYAWGNICDDEGNIYVTGKFRDIVDFDPGPGIAERSSYGQSDAYISKFDSGGKFIWTITIGGVGDDGFFESRYYEQGFLLINGTFSSIVDFEPGDGLTEYTSQGDSDAFLWKITKDGEMIWTRTWGGIFHERSIDNLIDSSGNIYVCGAFVGITDFDPDPDYVEYRESNGHEDAYLLKLNSNGSFIWVLTWGGNGPVNGDYAFSLAMDTSENIYTCGAFDGKVDFDPGPGVEEATATAILSAFLSKFNTDGEFIWVRTWGEDSRSVMTDNNDDVYVVGEFYGYNVDFDPGPGVDIRSVISPPWRSAYLMRLLSNGYR